MQDLQRKEMAEELRFKKGRLKLGPDKGVPKVGLGSVVMIERNPGGGPELGVLTHIFRGECTVELQNHTLLTTLAALTLITLMGKVANMMTPITHFFILIIFISIF